MQVGKMKQWIFQWIFGRYFPCISDVHQSVVELGRPQALFTSSYVWWVEGPMRHMSFQKNVLRCSFCVLPFTIDVWRDCQFHQRNLWHFMQHVICHGSDLSVLQPRLQLSLVGEGTDGDSRTLHQTKQKRRAVGRCLQQRWKSDVSPCVFCTKLEAVKLWLTN